MAATTATASKEDLELALLIINADWDLSLLTQNKDTAAELQAAERELKAKQLQLEQLRTDDSAHPLVRKHQAAQDLLDHIEVVVRCDKAEKQLSEAQADLFAVSGECSVLTYLEHSE
jgi:hypothetical protein